MNPMRWLICAALSLTPALAQAQADAFPSRPIRFMLPFGPGGTADALARVISPRLTEIWGQQIVIENRPGGGGILGMEAARTMPADGYNYVLVGNSAAASEAIYPKLNYDFRRDFLPVSISISSPMLIAVNAAFPVNNFQAMVAALQAEPNKRSYGSCGQGSAHQLAMELLKHELKFGLTHVPYKGCGPATLAVVSGQIDVVVGATASLMPHVRAGKLRAMAVTFDRRSPSNPDVPTVAESGGPRTKSFSVDNWYGFMAPAATPRDLAARVGRDINRVLAIPEVRERLAPAGIDVRTGDGAALLEAYLADLRQFKVAVDAAQIKPD